MNLKDKEHIDHCVRAYIFAANRADPTYLTSVPRDVAVTEIIRANGWFTDMDCTADKIREEVEKQLLFYTENA